MTKLLKPFLITTLLALLIILPQNFYPWSIHNQSSPSNDTVLEKIKLSKEERNWLKQNQPIRIAFDGYFPPYSFVDQTGQLQGISFDTIQLIAKKLDLELIVDKRTHWKEIFNAAVNKEIDVIATMVDRPGQLVQFEFTKPYVFKSLVIITHKTNHQIKNRSDLSGKTVALVHNYQYSSRILEDFPEITPYYVETMDDAMFAVETKQADAAISFFAASYFLQNKYLLNNIKFAAYYDRNSANESIAIRNDWPILAGILQKGLNSLTKTEKHLISAKWLPEIEMPVDYKTISKILVSFLLILFTLLIWLTQIKRQNKRIKITQNKLIIVNTELNSLKGNLEKQVSQRTEQLKNSEQKYRSLVENLQDEYFFYQRDLAGFFIYISPSITEILGYTTEQFLKHYKTFLTEHPDNEKMEHNIERCIQGERVPVYEIELFDHQQHKRNLELLESPLYNEEGECIGLEGIAHDITLLKQSRDRLNWLSYYDDLTGLANRRLFKDRIEQIITLSQRHQDSLALLFLDLDRFKIVNDSLGHAAGDEVLKETASRLKLELRDSDFAARMGGDEFTLILPATDATAAEIVAKKILQSFETPYILNDQQFFLGTSIGIAIYPQDGEDGDNLLQQADAAMYSAKKNKSGYAFCTTEQNLFTNRRIELEQDLRRALASCTYDENDELKVLFQSKHNIHNARIEGYEALIRWNHPKLGTLAPIEFIPIAEETGLIVELSRWAIKKVSLQAVTWANQNFNFKKIAINISAVELINIDLAKNIIQQIDETGAKREWFEIEITETALMKMPDVAVNIMQVLVNSGVLISIDDFGTGFSSLSYLKNLPASYIKIDQSFIRNVMNSPEDQAVVKAVVVMSHALGKKVIAEGVESQEQLKFLAENGCDIAQGYWFSMPLSANDLYNFSDN